MNERNFTGTLIETGQVIIHGTRVKRDRLHIEVDRKQYGKIKKHISDFCYSRQMCFRTTRIPCCTQTPNPHNLGQAVRFMIEVRLDKLDNPAEFESLEKVEVRYKMRRHFRRGRFPGVIAKLLSIEAI